MKRFALVLMCPLALVACSHEERATPQPGQPVKTVQPVFPEAQPAVAAKPEFMALAEGIRLADTVELFAGMPPPTGNGSESYATEIANNKAIQLHGWTFYEKPIAMEKADLETLRAACVNADNFRAATSPKVCEGFYPEYVVRWKHGEHAVDTIFRFGCGQVSERSGKTVQDFDMRTSAFEPVLKKYRPHRAPKG